MISKQNLANAIVAALFVAAFVPPTASAHEANGRLHFHPSTFIEAQTASVGQTPSTETVDRAACVVRHVSTPQGERLLQACD
ncbi:hypothetical protein [Methylocapsa acidiphila]|uniref:hypothetical protein n=1 Tax=Methylocapsa acidiphila TaxID=133552 RepID=UPI00041AA8E4|nr:hypothetical protein [Methylocapsa acidiphila]